MGSFALESPFFVHRPFSARSVSVSRGEGSVGLLCCRRLGGFDFRERLRIKHLAAINHNVGSESNEKDEPDDALEAAIKKNKKVIAVQNDLLKQIAQRKKLVSAIKDSVIDPDSNEFLFKDGNISFPSIDTPSNESEGITSSSSAHKNINSNDDDSSRSQFLNVRESLREEPQKGFSNEQKPVDVDIHKQSSDKTSRKDWSDELPLFLRSATSSQKDEKHEDLKESNVKEINEPTISQVETEKPPPLAGPNVMNIILVSAECAPWSKTGGLGDVAGALPKALARRGHRVMVVTPRYGNYAEAQDTGVRRRYMVDGQDMEVMYYQAYIDGVDYVFIDSPVLRHMENNIYGGKREDILKRMVLFCKAAVEVCWYVPCGGVCYGDGNLVFIANDWHTALLPVYLKAYYRDHGLMKYTRSILVIHNIAHQGRGPVDDFSKTDLPPHYLDLFKMYDPVGGEHFNIFAAGLKSADRIVTVSHGYAWELKTLEGGWGLHNIINENDWKLQGIVNGIDAKDWNPEFDVHLKSDGYTNYTLETLQRGKAQCKAALQKELGLPVRDDVPLIGFIGRLDHQKGVDIIAEAIPWMVNQDVQLVMLGTGREDLEQMLRNFESQYRDKIRGWVGFSVKTAHRITAGADILLMPSRFEPCGLNQLYAMRYGTVPVVHAVGGLRDTVHPFDPYNESGFGWTFERAEADKLIHALGNCFWTYREFRKSWEGIQRRGMMQNLSWDHAAEKYEEVLVAAKYQW